MIAYSLPWATVDSKLYVGWNFTIPFSITYFIGLLLGLIVLIVKFKPVMMTIIAGILMLLGIVGAFLGLGTLTILAGFVGSKVNTEAGIGFALIMSIIYTVLGAYVGKKLIMKKTK
jgi:hypothetical protein